MTSELNHSLKSLLDLYFVHRLLRPASKVCYQDAVNSLMKVIGKSEVTININNITVNLLLEWRSETLKRNAATSFNKHRRHLRALFNFAVQEGLLATSPLSKVSAAPCGKRRPKTVPWTWLRKTRELLSANHPKLQPCWFWRAVVDVMYFGMIRRRQLIEMTWADVHFHNNSITLSSEGSKSRKEWAIPLPKQVMDELAIVKAKMREKIDRVVSSEDQVFCWPLFSEHADRFKTNRMKVEHLSDFFNRLSGILGFTISSHRVRHTSATIMLARSTDLKGTSEMLGHSTITLTADTYIHPSIGALRKAQRKMPFYADSN